MPTRNRFLAVSLSVVLLISLMGLGSFKLHIAYASTETLYGCIENANQGTGGGPGLSQLYTINTSNGTATLIGATGFYGCFGLAFSPSDVLYTQGEETAGGAQALYTLNTTSGVGTLIGSNNASTSNGEHMGQLAFQPGTGTLYADWEGASDEVLFTIDPTTAQATEVGVIASGFSSGFRGSMLAFDPDGTLYFSTCVVGVCNASVTQVYTVDPATAVPTLAFTLDVSGTCAGKTSLNSGYFDVSDNLWYDLNCYGSNYIITADSPPTIDPIGQTVTSMNAIAFQITTPTTTTAQPQSGGCCANPGTTMTTASTTQSSSSSSASQSQASPSPSPYSYTFPSTGIPVWILLAMIITIGVAAPLGIIFRRRRPRHF
jgi:hypothetical protein